jgi:collagen beta-1,O-galactosyltransferase
MIDEIYVINLIRRVDRLNEFKSRYPGDITKVKIFEAIDGKEIDNYELDDIEKKNLEEVLKNKKSVGTTGCFSSHYRIWKQIVNNPLLSPSSRILIYEDDAFFSDNYMDKLKNIDRLKNFDILYIGGRFHPNYVESKKRIPFDKSTEQRTTHAYIITKDGANKLLQIILNEKIIEIDSFLNHTKYKLNAYDMYPHINWSPVMYKTDIQDTRRKKIINTPPTPPPIPISNPMPFRTPAVVPPKPLRIHKKLK